MGALIPVVAQWAMNAAAYIAGSVGFTFSSVGGFMAAAAAINIAGIVAIGYALQQLMPEPSSASYAGQKLQTTKSNTDAVPIIYGYNRLAGNIIYQATNNYNGGTTNNDYWAIIVIGQGELEEFVKMYENEDELTLTNGVFHNDYVQIKPYTTSGEGIALSDVEFATDAVGGIDTGEVLLGYPSITVSSNSTYAYNLLDGSLKSEWLPEGTNNNEWIKITSFSTEIPKSIQLYLGLGGHVLNLQYSDDDSIWVDAGISIDTTGVAEEDKKWYSVPIDDNIGVHPFWRILFTSRIGRIYELDYKSDKSSSMSIPKNVAFLAVHQKYVATNTSHIQLGNISTEVKGKKILYAGTEQVGYSYQAVDIVYDIMVNYLGINASDIDINNFLTAKINNNTNKAYCNIVFNQQVNFESALNSVLATIRSQLLYTNGKWKLVYDHRQIPVKTLTNNDVLANSLTIGMKSNEDIANKITLKYVNPEDEWQAAEVSYTDDDLVVIDGQEIEMIIDVRGITNYTQAYNFARLSLNQMRYTEDDEGNRIKQTPLTCEFSTTLKNADLEVGDVISLSHDLLDRERMFKIISLSSDQSGAIKLSLTEYCETHYKDKYDAYFWV